MKLTLLISCFTALQISASVYSQNTKISLKSNNGKFSEILSAIEEQTDFKVFYKNEQVDLNRKVLLSSTLVSISDLLGEALNGTNMSYTFMDKIIVLSPREAAAAIKQQLAIKGKVFDENGNALPGVNIMEKGTTNGTTSDLDGKFSLTVASSQTILVFTFVGYTDSEIQVGSQSDFSVTMVPDLKHLDEVVVIGYGVQKKKLVTGATTHVNGEDMEKLNTTNALQALQGQSAGINITSASGQPGEGMKVVIRGIGSIGGSQPLYIVDGVETGDIKYLNSSDIEAVDVLKDAASAAIYGSRAANGVVLITTKQGKSGKAQVTFDAYYGIQNRAKKIDMLDAKQYAMIMNEQHINSGGSPSNLPFNVNNLPAYTSEGSADTHWLDEMFVKNAKTQNYTFGVLGGNDNSTYSMALSYAGQEGIVGGKDKSNYQRYGARFNSEHKLYNNKLNIGQHLTYSYTQKLGVQVGNQYSNSLRGAFNTSPLLPMYNDNGDFFNSYDQTIVDQFGNLYWNNKEANPYASMVINNQEIDRFQKIVGDIYGELEIIKNLKFRTTFGLDYYSEQDHSFSPIYRLSFYAFNDESKARQSLTTNYSIKSDNVLNYKLSLNEHVLEAMLGYSARYNNGEWLYGENYNTAFNDLEHAWLSNATNVTDATKMTINGGPSDQDYMISYFGRIQYNYRETYMFNSTFRRDGSSKFPKTNNIGSFISFSAGWTLTNESFFQPFTNVVNYFKLRASWGQNGNNNIPAFYYAAPIKFTQATYNFGNQEGVSINGSYPSRVSNDKLQWETAEQINVGFDSKFLNNNLSATFDWFRKSSKNWLVIPPILATVGTAASAINGGNVINSGVELSLNYSNHFGKINYNVNVNGTYIKNNVEEIPTDDHIIHGATNSLYANSTEFYRAESGHPIGYFWGYQTDGLFQSTSDVSNYIINGKVVQPNAKPGDVKYVDQDKNGVINVNDKVEIGDPNPDYMFGLTFSCDYKAFDFSVFANGVAGNQIVQSYRNHTDKYSNYTSAILGRWTGAGTSNTIPRVTNSNVNYQFSDLFIQNGSYLRISNVSLGYDLAKIVKLKNFSQCRFYISVQNLYTFTAYDGMDPEIGYGFNNGPTDNFSSGIDLGYYPRPRTVMFGINLKF